MRRRHVTNIGWIGTGRMGYPMVTRLLKAGHNVRVWNRSVEKARPLAAVGAQVVDRLESLGDLDILFTVVTNGDGLHEVCFGPSGAFADTRTKVPRILVDCSTIGVPESEALREKLAKRQVAYLTAPVSGNPECVVAGQLSSVVSGPQEAFDEAEETGVSSDAYRKLNKFRMWLGSVEAQNKIINTKGQGADKIKYEVSAILNEVRRVADKLNGSK